jgi:predicted ABC-type ATPase
MFAVNPESNEAIFSAAFISPDIPEARESGFTIAMFVVVVMVYLRIRGRGVDKREGRVGK